MLNRFIASSKSERLVLWRRVATDSAYHSMGADKSVRMMATAFFPSCYRTQSASGAVITVQNTGDDAHARSDTRGGTTFEL
jgi:hypothetical protein